MKSSAKLPTYIKGASSYDEIEQISRQLVDIKNICMTSSSTNTTNIRSSKIPIRPVQQDNILHQLSNANKNNNNCYNQNDDNNNITSTSSSSLVPHIARLKLCNSSPITRRDREKISYLNDQSNNNNEYKSNNDLKFNKFLDNDNIGNNNNNNNNNSLKSRERKNPSGLVYNSLDLSILEDDTGSKKNIRKERAMTIPKSESDVSSFQDAAKARISLVMKKKRAQQLLQEEADFLIAIKPPRTGESLQEKQIKKDRYRAEVYAINSYLKKLEFEKFELLKKEKALIDTPDDISWCSDDSSVLPTPRYRTAAELKKTNQTREINPDNKQSIKKNNSNNNKGLKTPDSPTRINNNKKSSSFGGV